MPSQRPDGAADKVQQPKTQSSNSHVVDVIELVSDDEADIETIECPLCGSVIARNMLEKHLEVIRLRDLMRQCTKIERVTPCCVHRRN